MADDLDAARIGIQLDRAEECGAIETDVAEALRSLVPALGWGWSIWALFAPSPVVQAGAPIRAGEGVAFEQDERIYPSSVPYAGFAARNIREREIVRWDQLDHRFG